MYNVGDLGSQGVHFLTLNYIFRISVYNVNDVYVHDIMV